MRPMFSLLFRRFCLAIALMASLSCISCVDAVQANGADPANECGVPSPAERAEALELLARYGPYVDYHQGEAWASLFTEDGELDYPTIGDPTGSRTRIKGHDALVAFASGNSTPGLVFAHYSGQTILVSAGPGRMKALTPVGVVVVKTDAQFAADFQALGVYEDLIVRTAKGWRFQRRTADIYASLPLPPEFLPCAG